MSRAKLRTAWRSNIQGETMTKTVLLNQFAEIDGQPYFANTYIVDGATAEKLVAVGGVILGEKKSEAEPAKTGAAKK